MSEPTSEELKVLKKFREAIQDLGLSPKDSTDLQLLRWLRARDLNIAKANEMFRKSLEWRKSIDMDNFMDWKMPERFEKDYPYELVGLDKTTGHPITIWPVGSWDCKKAIALEETEALILYAIQMFGKIQLKMEEASKLVGWEVTQSKYLIDFQHFSLRSFTAVSSILLPLARRFEENFPEIVHTVILINCSQAFQLLFALVKTIVSSRTLSKCQVYQGEKIWRPVIEKTFPLELDLIPEQYGGTKKCAILQSLEELDIEDENELTLLEVKPGEKGEIEILVPRSNMEIIWLFSVEKQEIGFSIIQKSTEEQILPYRIYKYDSVMNVKDDERFSGHIGCGAGTYVGVFDNSSGKDKKEVKYAFTVTDK